MNIIISGFGCNDQYFVNLTKRIKIYKLYHLDCNKSVDMHIFDLLKVCDQYSQVNLIGFSMGCYIALLLEKHVIDKLHKIILISPTNIFFWWPTTDCCMTFPKHFEPLRICKVDNIPGYIKVLHILSTFKFLYKLLSYVYYCFYSIKAKEPLCLIQNMSNMNVLCAWTQIKSILIDLNFYQLIRNVVYDKKITIITGTCDYNFEFCNLLQEVNGSKLNLKVINGANHHMIYFEWNHVYSCLLPLLI